MQSLLIRHAQIYSVTSELPQEGDILICDGKITAIGPELSVPDGVPVLDVAGKRAYPGFVEAHAHLGLHGHVGFVATDVNESTEPLTPHLRAIDAINPFDEDFLKAAMAGVTTVATGPGSTNPVGGVFTALKTCGRRVDDMVIKSAVGMKCAFGENVKNCYRDKSINTRMGAAARLRELLFKTQEYQTELEVSGRDDKVKRPKFNMKLEAMLPVIRGELPLKVHAHQANDIFTAIRIAKEFNLKLTIEHCTEGHLIADYLAAEGYPVAIGPSMSFSGKFELIHKTFKTPGILNRAGCLVSIITDSPVVLQEYLPLAAGLAVKAGMDPYEALKAITINPAIMLGIADRVGTLEVGKDGDVVITDGSPFEITTRIFHTIIDGAEVPRPQE